MQRCSSAAGGWQSQAATAHNQSSSVACQSCPEFGAVAPGRLSLRSPTTTVCTLVPEV